MAQPPRQSIEMQQVNMNKLHYSKPMQSLTDDVDVEDVLVLVRGLLATFTLPVLNMGREGGTSSFLCERNIRANRISVIIGYYRYIRRQHGRVVRASVS